MKIFLKAFYKQSITLIQTIISIFSVLFFSKFTLRTNLKKYKRKFDYCFLVGNGPSLKKIIREEKGIFIGQDVFTVNLSYESSFFREIKPKNHIIADSGFWKPAEDDRMKGIQKRFKDYLLEVTWEMNLFVPYAGCEFVTKTLSANKKIAIIPYNHTPVNGYKCISHFFYRNNLGMPRASNVLNAAIFIALNVGYKKLYIYGADHSWLKDLFIDENNNLCSYQNHFYEDKKVPYIMAKGSLLEGLRGMIEALESYKLLDIYSKSVNSMVINKTDGSYIDIFDHE
jgi:hypothetical protein